MTAELLSKAGFDWLLLDLEHGPGDILNLISQLQAIPSGVIEIP
jgi:2-dehydro-3-deoxyglucarate aldolase/4-hydroxy-2-oxoheptanedioate aldolase